MKLNFNLIYFLGIFALQLNLLADNLNWFPPPTIDEIKKKNKISIVFVSQNLKSPISMFGHTFIVAHNDVIPEPDAIIIEFLGDTSRAEDGHLNALFSSIHGNYKLNNFLIKKRENEDENRDYWIYKIDLSTIARKKFNEEIEKRLSKEYRYNFISKNCSYYILDLIAHSEDEILASANSFIYTLPIETIRKLRSKKLVNDSIYLPSAQKTLLNQYNNLSKNDQLNFNTILSGQSVAPPFEEPLKLKSTLSKAISYKIPREPNREIRTTLYRLKLKYPIVDDESALSYIEAEPSQIFGETSLSLGYDFKKTNWLLTFKPAQRDFFSSKKDGLETSYMDIGKIWVEVKNNNLKLTQFNLFKIESIKEETEFSDAFNRYIDLSYYDWSGLTDENSSEVVVRIGEGWSSKVSNFRYGILPYLGISNSKIPERTSTNFDMGYKLILNYWFSDKFRMEGSYIHYFNSAFSFDGLINLSAVANINSKLNFGLSYLTTNKDKDSTFTSTVIIFF